MNLKLPAQNYTTKGISCIPTDNTKRSIVSWKQYQQRIPTQDEINQMFDGPRVQGIAVICGAVSGNLEVIDVDCKYGVDFDQYAEKIKAADPVLYDKLLIVKTKSNGYHIYYRCEYIEGNQKLAERPATDDELHDNPNVKQCVLIETRGDGGYVVAPPTDGYNPVQIREEIPVISINERETLISIAKSFNQIIEHYKLPTLPHNNDIVTVWDDYNKRGDVVALLEKHGWTKTGQSENKMYWLRPGYTTSAHSAVLFTDTRIFYPHTTSSVFENKGYNPFSIYAVLECNGDFKKAVKQLAGVYGQQNNDGWFWTYSKNGAVTIQRFMLQEWLHANNYQLYFHDVRSGIYRLIHEDNKIVREVYPESIKKFIKQKLVDAKHYEVMEAIMRQTNSIFNDSFFEYIDKSDVEILRDESNKCYFPFKNGIITITKDGIDLIKYGAIHQSIWDSQIINFEVIINHEIELKECKFYQFISKISGDDPERILYAMTLIGYILHSYKDPARPYAPILAEETDDEAKGGGTGKGLFFQAISKLVPTVRIDGKNFKPDKSFAFQRVTLGTKLVVIEDCPKNVDFEKYYPTITEGMTVEKKNKDELFLSYNESPKIAFTTNYSISNTAEHAKRRQRVLEFAPFFSSKYTPFDHFGHKLFDEWEHEEWQRFYNFMFICVQMYLDEGIKQIENSDKLKRKQIKMQFGEDFLDYFDDLIKEHLGQGLGVSDEWKNYLNRYEIDRKDYSLKRFKKGLQMGSQILGMDYIDYKNRQNNNLKMFKIEQKGENEQKSVTDVTDLF
jgi:hypothetical protein